MAQPSLESFRKRGLTLKAEVTEGVDSVPVAATDGFDLFEGSCETAFDTVERIRDRPFFTNDAFSVARRRATISGQMELVPPAIPGVGAMPGALALRIAGTTQVLDAGADTTRYNPISSGVISATAYWYHVDRLLRVTGVRQNITGLSMAIGQRFMAQCQFMGQYEEVEESALPSIVLADVNPTIANPNNSLFRISTLDDPATATDLLIWAKSVSVDFGNTIDLKEYTEHAVTSISDRKATFSMQLSRTDLDDLNVLKIRDAGALITAYIQTNEPDGRYSRLGIRGQIENVTPADIGGDYGYDVTGRCIASSAGGDEFFVEFGVNAS